MEGGTFLSASSEVRYNRNLCEMQRSNIFKKIGKRIRLQNEPFKFFSPLNLSAGLAKLS
jgi:hypothetical protein